MLVTTGLVLIGAWGVSLFGVFGGGDLRHALLLLGLLLLMIGGLKSRDAARHDGRAGSTDRQ